MSSASETTDEANESTKEETAAEQKAGRIQARREEQNTVAWKAKYRQRSGIEGVIRAVQRVTCCLHSQAVQKWVVEPQKNVE